MLADLGPWSPSVPVVATTLHVFCGVFWPGWMVFTFANLRPVAVRVVPDRAAALQGQIQQRIRRIALPRTAELDAPASPGFPQHET